MKISNLLGKRKTMLQQTLEERVAHVEQDLAQLKSQIQHLRPGQGWIDRITGSFKDDPDFDEILRLGQEIRRADRLNPDGP
jgi:hypothetical protein